MQGIFSVTLRIIGARGSNIPLAYGISFSDAIIIQKGVVSIIEYFKHPKRITTSVIGDHLQVMSIDDTKIYNNSELVCMIYIKEI